ncbi:MAG: aspartate-semialdehyde dehydrogenase [Gammaproteobacteria bacterium]
MSSKQGMWDIAVVGATGLVGTAVLELLAQRSFPVGQVFPLASENSEGDSVAFGKRHLSVHTLEGFDFRQVQLALFCVPASVATQYIPSATQANCVVVDLSEAYRLDPQVPLVVAEVNADAIADYQQRNLIACPDSSILQLALTLQPLHQHNPLERINAVLLRAVSELGRAGIDELSGQSIALFNLKEIKRKQFEQQIAFNVLGQAGGRNVKDGANREMQLQQELQKILEDPDIGMNATAIQVPVFFGHSAALHVEFEDKLSTEQARKLLESQTRIRLVEDASAVSHAASDEHIYVSRVREDPTWDRGLNLGTVLDNVSAAANNGVHVAEILVKDYL